MIGQAQYDSSPEFQQRIVASIVRDESFFKSYFTCVKASYFQQDTHKKIVEQCITFFSQYNRLPDRVELEHATTQALKGEASNTQYVQQLIPVYQRDITDLFIIPAELLVSAQVYAVDFAKRAAFKTALIESAKTLNEPDALEKAQKRLSEAAQVGLNMSDFGIDYFKNLKERHLKRINQPVEAMRLPFLIPKLDAMCGGIGYRKNGGVPEMCVFLAPTNRGKSRALGHCAKVALSLGLKVAIFSAEMAAELYAERLDMSLGILTTPELYDPQNYDKLERRIQLYNQQGGQLFIKKYPSRQATIAQTVALLHHMKLAIDFKPDVVIYDYIDEFSPPKGATDERRHELSAISSAIRAVADEFGAAVITATQANRDALTREVVDLQHIAEDIGKANIADIIISLCQTKVEEAAQPPEQRWLVCKNRSGPKGQLVRVIDDVTRMRFLQHPEERLEETIEDLRYTDKHSEGENATLGN